MQRPRVLWTAGAGLLRIRAELPLLPYLGRLLPREGRLLLAGDLHAVLAFSQLEEVFFQFLQDGAGLRRRLPTDLRERRFMLSATVGQQRGHFNQAGTCRKIHHPRSV